jgi:arsenate reductase
MLNTDRTTVLFLSTGDAARGIMAEALLRACGQDRFTALSAGYKMQPQVAPDALSLLRAEGVSTDGLYTKGWGQIFEAPQSILVDVIVTLSEEARIYCPRWPGDPLRVHWPVDDPMAAADADSRDWKLRKCLATLRNRVDALAKQRTPHSQAERMLQFRSISAVV